MQLHADRTLAFDDGTDGFLRGGRQDAARAYYGTTGDDVRFGVAVLGADERTDLPAEVDVGVYAGEAPPTDAAGWLDDAGAETVLVTDPDHADAFGDDVTVRSLDGAGEHAAGRATLPNGAGSVQVSTPRSEPTKALCALTLSTTDGPLRVLTGHDEAFGLHEESRTTSDFRAAMRGLDTPANAVDGVGVGHPEVAYGLRDSGGRTGARSERSGRSSADPSPFERLADLHVLDDVDETLTATLAAEGYELADLPDVDGETFADAEWVDDETVARVVGAVDERGVDPSPAVGESDEGEATEGVHDDENGRESEATESRSVAESATADGALTGLHDLADEFDPAIVDRLRDEGVDLAALAEAERGDLTAIEGVDGDAATRVLGVVALRGVDPTASERADEPATGSGDVERSDEAGPGRTTARDETDGRNDGDGGADVADDDRLVDSLGGAEGRLDDLRGRVDDALVDALADAGYDLADVRDADVETLAATPLGETNARAAAAAAHEARDEAQASGDERAATDAPVESFEDLTDLTQMGEGRLDVLRDAGYDSLDDVAAAQPSDLAEGEQVGDLTAARVWTAAQGATGYEAAAFAASVESFEDLTDLTQMGEGRLDVLRDAGYGSLDDVAGASPSALADLGRMGPETAARVCVGARAVAARERGPEASAGDREYGDGQGR